MIVVRNDIDFFDACSSDYAYDELEDYPHGIKMQELYNLLYRKLKKYFYEPLDAQYAFEDNISKKQCWIADNVDFNRFSLNWNEAMLALYAVYADYPLLFFSDIYKTGGFPDKGFISPVIDADSSRGDFRVFYAQKIETEIKKTVQGLKSDITCREAAKDVYEIMKNTGRYDRNKGTTNYVDIPSHSILNYVRNRSAVCQGFARTYQAIMNYIFVPTVEVSVLTEGGGKHSCNLVYLIDERKWILVDVTQGIVKKNDSGFDVAKNSYVRILRETGDCELTKYSPEYNTIWEELL